MAMHDSPLFIPLILGTARAGRRSEQVARFVCAETQKRAEIATAFVDVRDFRLPATDDSGESEAAKELAAITSRADGFIIVSPEYNHGYPGELKVLLDMSEGEYAKKPVALCGVSAGTTGGARMMEQLRSVLIDLGATPILAAVHFPMVQELFDADGKITDDSYRGKVSKMLDELLWYTRALKAGRER